MSESSCNLPLGYLQLVSVQLGRRIVTASMDLYFVDIYSVNLKISKLLRIKIFVLSKTHFFTLLAPYLGNECDYLFITALRF